MACDYISSCSPKFAAAWMNLGIVQAAQNKTQVHRLHRYSVHTCTHVYACVRMCACRWNESSIRCCVCTQEAEVSYMTAIQHRRKYPDAYYNLGNMVCPITTGDDRISAPSHCVVYCMSDDPSCTHAHSTLTQGGQTGRWLPSEKPYACRVTIDCRGATWPFCMRTWVRWL